MLICKGYFLASPKRLFEAASSATLKLVETQTFTSGVVVLTYRPERKE
jgi:hypothetical protein